MAVNNFKGASFDFPTTLIKEGKISVVVPTLKMDAPSRAPVFFNPVMKFNRDLAILALQTYQKMVGREISVCEPFTGCGIRGIRFALEVDGLLKVVLGDINPKAARLAQFNVRCHNLEERVLVLNKDANLLLSQHAIPYKRFDFIDIDPFGSPAPYIDSAIRALRNGGMLALTATDMPPLCGVYPRVCIRKYGGKSMRTEYCHELAIRLLTGCIAMIGAKHEVGVKVVFSHSTNHYIRVYCLTNRGAKQADKSIQEMGYILHCFSCGHRETSKGIISHLKWKCVYCGSTLNVAGPLWLGKIFDKKFCSLMIKEALGRHMTKDYKILNLLSLVQKESDGPSTYYITDKVCDILNTATPPFIKVVNRLRRKGFQATQTHFHNRGIRTDASIKIIQEIILQLSQQTAS